MVEAPPLGDRGHRDAVGGGGSLTPETVAHLPGPVHDVVLNSYNDALLPIFAPSLLSALALVYIDGVLDHAVTRGDGRTGEDPAPDWVTPWDRG